MANNVHPTSAVKNLKKGKTKMANINILQMIEQCQVEWKMLGEVTYYEQPTKYLVKSSNYNDDFDTPVLTAGKTFILGYTDEREGIYFASESPVIIFDDFTTANKWVDFDFKVKSSAMKMITSKDEKKVLLKYIYYWLNTVPSELAEGDHKRQWISSYANKSLPIPPLEIQKEIVKILDKLTELEATLEAELSLREKQYQYYRDHLLSFGDDVEWKSLGDVCDYVDYRGKTPKKVDSGIYLVTAKNIKKGFIDYDVSKEYVSEEEYLDIMRRGLPKLGDVLITTEAPCGNIAQVDNENIALAQRVIKYCTKKPNVLRNDFLKFLLLGQKFQNDLMRISTGGTVKGVKGSLLHQLKIPIPPLETQAKIVEILDKFDRLTHSLSEGLPKEIELRRKQYEYYREKLLNFPK